MNIPNKRKVLQWQWVSVFWEISKPVRFYYSMNSSLCLLNLWNHIDDNLPHVSVSFHVLMSLCNVIQAKCAVNHWPQGGRLVWEIWQHPACKSFHQVSFVLWKENAKYISGPVANIYITRDVWKVTQASCLILATRPRRGKQHWQESAQRWRNTAVVSLLFSILTCRLRERRRLVSKWPRLDSSLPSRSPSTALPPMVPYSTHLPSMAKELTFDSQLRPPMQSRITFAPLPVKLEILQLQVTALLQYNHVLDSK